MSKYMKKYLNVPATVVRIKIIRLHFIVNRSRKIFTFSEIYRKCTLFPVGK